MADDNVIKFPNQKRDVVVQDDFPQQLELSHEDVLELVDALGSNVLLALHELGFTFQNKNKEIGLMLESIRALVYRAQEKEHAFHELAEHLFIESEPGILRFRHMVKKLKEEP